MKNLLSYKLKTYFLGFLLCITFSALQGQEINDSLFISLDSTKITTTYVSQRNILFEKVKIPLVQKDSVKTLWILPALSWNNYDKTQLGLMLGYQNNRFAITAAPMIGLGSKNLTGMLWSSLNIPSEKISNILIRAKALRFSYLIFPEDLAYNKIEPEIVFQHRFKFKGLVNFHFKHSSVWQEYLLGGRQTTYFYANTIMVEHTTRVKKLYTKTNGAFIQANQFGTFEIQNRLQIQYKKSNNFYLRTYMGAFLYNSKASTNIQAPLPVLQLSGSVNNGIYWLQKDYLFDDFYLDRNGQDDFLRRQMASSEGGFLSLTSLGNVNSFLLASNLKSDVMLPEKVKNWVNLQVYMNFAVGANKNTTADLYAEGGASLLFFQEIIGFHIPFATTNNIKENQATAFDIQEGQWPKRITFSINFQKILRKQHHGINH